MFEKGEYIIYGTAGVCIVTDIKTMNMQGIPKDKLFYVLMPYNHNGSMIFTPVDNTKTVMRKVMTKEQAQKVIEDVPDMEELYFSNDKLREEKYKECIKSGDCRDLTRVIKTLYLKRKAKLEQGKKFAAVDERHLKMAEDNLYSELAVALGVDRQDVRHSVEELL